MKEFTLQTFWQELGGYLNRQNGANRADKSLSALITCTFLILCFTINAQVNIRGVAPVESPQEGFAIDGDVFAGQPSSPVDYSAYGDWFFSGDTPGGIFPANINVNNINENGQVIGAWDPNTTFFFRDDITNNDPTIFTSSNKINDSPTSYTWGPGSSPNKNEIQNAMVHFSFGNPLITPPGDTEAGDSDDLWIIFAADREVTNGSSYIDFELLQKPLTRIGTTSGGFATEGLHGGRTLDDLLITLEFTQGGGAANVVVRKWQSDGAGGFHYADFIANPTGDKVLYSTNNTQTIEVPFPLYNQTALANGNYQYTTNQWAEGAANLSEIFGSDPCFNISTLFVRTRTSGSSGRSELKDFPGGPVQLQLDLNPIANLTTSGVCDGDTAVFTATPTGSGEQYTFFVDTDEDGEIDAGETILQAKSDDNTYEDDSLNNDDIITVLVETTLGCINSASEEAIIYANPVTNAGADAEDCDDNGASSISLNGSASGGTPGYTYTWSPSTYLDDANVANPTFSGAPASVTPYTLTLTVTDSKGCTDTDTVDLTITANPVANAGADAEDCDDNGASSISLNGSASGGTGPYDYSWSPATYLDDATAEDPVFSGAPASETPYTLTFTVTDANGCMDTDTVDITINENPTVSIQQPQLDCFSDAPSMIVTSPVDKSGLEFRLVIKGQSGSFADYPSGGYTGLLAETTYVLTARDETTLCEVDKEFTTGRILDTPITPTLEADQPDCDTFQGAIRVTNHIAGQTYWVKLKTDTGDPDYVSYPTNGFENLDPGEYVVIARSTDLCSSGGAEITLTEPECNHLFPTQTECSDYLYCNTDNFVQDYMCVTVKKVRGVDQVTNVIPGALFYYADLNVENSQLGTQIEIKVEQTPALGFKPFDYVNDANVRVYVDGCEVATIDDIQWVVGTGENSGKYYVVIKYTPQIAGLTVVSIKWDPKTANGSTPASIDNNDPYHNFYKFGMIVDGEVETGSFGTLGMNTAKNCSDPVVFDRSDCEFPSRQSESLAKESLIEDQPLKLIETSEPKFSAYPVPFRENLNIGYKFDYTSDVTIQIFNINGQLLKTYTEKAVDASTISTLDIDFERRASQIYIVRMITDREVFTKKIISAK